MKQRRGSAEAALIAHGLVLQQNEAPEEQVEDFAVGPVPPVIAIFRAKRAEHAWH